MKTKEEIIKEFQDMVSNSEMITDYWLEKNLDEYADWKIRECLGENEPEEYRGLDAFTIVRDNSAIIRNKFRAKIINNMEEKKQEVADEELTKDDEKQGFLVDNFDEVFNEFFPFADTD